MLVLTNTHMLKKSRIFVNRISRYGGPADCHGKRINLKAKRKTAGKKETKGKPQGKKKNLTAKRKRLAAKRITPRQKTKE